MEHFRVSRPSVDHPNRRSWNFLNWGSDVLLESVYEYKDGRGKLIWKRPVSGDGRDGSDEPPVPISVRNQAVRQLSARLRFIRWEDR